MLSPISEDYREELGSIVEVLNRLTPGQIESRLFNTLASGIDLLERVIAEM